MEYFIAGIEFLRRFPARFWERLPFAAFPDPVKHFQKRSDAAGSLFPVEFRKHFPQLYAKLFIAIAHSAEAPRKHGTDAHIFRELFEMFREQLPAELHKISAQRKALRAVRIFQITVRHIFPDEEDVPGAVIHNEVPDGDTPRSRGNDQELIVFMPVRQIERASVIAARAHMPESGRSVEHPAGFHYFQRLSALPHTANIVS